jgi:hypothetical protein
VRLVYLILLLVIVAILVVFVVQNREDETVTFFNQRITAPPVLVFRRGVLPGHVERRDRRRLPQAGVPTRDRARGAQAGVAGAVRKELK